MKVKDLIKKLEKVNPDSKVSIGIDNINLNCPFITVGTYQNKEVVLWGYEKAGEEE